MSEKTASASEDGSENKEEGAAYASELGRMSLPAVYTDHFQILYWKGHLRIAFGETSLRSDIHWRYAVLLEEESARDLVRRINRVLKIMDLQEEEPDNPND